MSDLVYEIGVEELPSSFVAKALDALPGLVGKALADLRLEHGEIRALGTPRRLAVFVAGLAERQPDLEETVYGPPVQAAFDADGTPKKAAIGFAKKLGIPVEELRQEETEKGVKVAGTRAEVGRPAAEVLGPALGSLIPQIPFPKAMRWGDGDLAFGRPIHWLLALLDEAVLPVTLESIEAGRATRGHRFLHPEAVELATASDYVAALRDAHVYVDPDERLARMQQRIRVAATEAGGTLVEDPFLDGENVSMVEEPFALAGHFDDDFLSLPEDVAIEVMRGHQRYYALRGPDGALLARYVVVANTAEAPELVIRGNDRVLRARLADARFFVEEDRKRALAEHAEGLADVTYQAKLGSMAERVARFGEIVTALGDDGPAAAAAALCKADLVTLIVGEFPELQGIMGRWYASREGVDAAVATAIEEHYRPRGASDEVPETAVGARLAVADRADALVGGFGLGQSPTGSADPFGLRRAALGVVRIALEGPIDVDLAKTLKAAYAAYAAQDKPLVPESDVLRALDGFFRGRLEVFYGAKYPVDLVKACLGAWDGTSLQDLGARMAALSTFRALPAYESLAIAFKRAHNISADAPGGAPDPALFQAEAERALADAFAGIRTRVAGDVEAGRYEAALTLVAEELRGPVDRFFDDVMVMVDDDALRNNRLRLLAEITGMLTAIAHFHQLGA